MEEVFALYGKSLRPLRKKSSPFAYRKWWIFVESDVPKSRYKSRYKSRINQEREKVFNSGIFNKQKDWQTDWMLILLKIKCCKLHASFCSMPVIKNLPFRNQKRQVKGCIWFSAASEAPHRGQHIPSGFFRDCLRGFHSQHIWADGVRYMRTLSEFAANLPAQ